MADWRDLLTVQGDCELQVPYAYTCMEEYIARFEDLNWLKRTTDFEYRKKDDASKTVLPKHDESQG